MEKIEREIPCNFSEMKQYIITDVQEISNNIILAEKCYFYDTCSFRNHMVSSEQELLFDFIKETSGIVIITRTVLMELCSGDGCLWKEQIEYIKNMFLYGIKVLVIYEEDVFDVLHTVYSDVAEINKWLSFAVKYVKNKTGKVEELVRQDGKLKQVILAGEECKDSKLAKCLFTKIRSHKTPQDNMGEELLAISVHWLSRMRNFEEYKYIVLTDDKKAIPVMGKVIKNVREYLGSNSIAVCTTIKLCSLLQKADMIDNENQILKMLSYVNSEHEIKVYCSAEFELYPTEKSMSVQEYARAVFQEKIKVYF